MFERWTRLSRPSEKSLVDCFLSAPLTHRFDETTIPSASTLVEFKAQPISMKIDYIECHILCGEKVLREYQEMSDCLPANPDPESNSEDRKAKKCCIISEEGKRFIAVVKSDPHQFDASCELWIDGQCAELVCIQDIDDHCFNGARVSDTQVRPYAFSNILSTEDERVFLQNQTNAQDIGTITLKIFRIKEIANDTSPWVMANVSTLQVNLENQPVHEKVKKAGSHRVVLGDPETVETITPLNGTYIDAEDFPYYTFTWRYRPKAMLQAQGIVPLDRPSLKRSRPSTGRRTGQPSKRPRKKQPGSQQRSSPEVKTEDLETARELQIRRSNLRAQRAALEAQVAALDAQEADLQEDLRQADAKGIKREHSPIVLGASSGDIIDLTGDD